jgi:NADH:ubiquinone oxidoreductase subunit K
MDRLNAPWIALRFGIGLTATLAGLDKFVNLLADWGRYVSPLAAQVLPFSTDTFMGIVGVIELAVGVAILTGWTRLGAYVASGWLIAVALNLVAAGFYDVAVRDVVMAIAAFTLARLEEAREAARVKGFATAAEASRRQATI